MVSDDGTVSVNTAPTVSTDGAALGRKNAAFAWKYTVTDADGDTLTVAEKLDGKTAKTRTGVASGTTMTFEQTASAAGFQKILNGNHTITVEVSDGKETVSTSATFTKAVHAARAHGSSTLALAGGVSANRALRGALARECEEQGIRFCCPDFRYCTDNAAMIACAGHYALMAGELSGLDLNAAPELPLVQR